MRNRETIERAKQGRRKMTAAEARLWSFLRHRRFHQVKFRRQHAIGPYVVDFACTAARLVLEVDGPSHSIPEQIAFDAQRTQFLEAAGWRVLRIANSDALYDLGAAGARILNALEA